MLATNLVALDHVISVRESSYKTYDKCICIELYIDNKSSGIYLRTVNDKEFDVWFKNLSASFKQVADSQIKQFS